MTAIYMSSPKIFPIPGDLPADLNKKKHFNVKDFWFLATQGTFVTANPDISTISTLVISNPTLTFFTFWITPETWIALPSPYSRIRE